jgi:hypothetical protein
MQGVKYAENYDYKPGLLGAILDRLPHIGGYRNYKRAMDYYNQVHNDNPDMDIKDFKGQRVHEGGKASGAMIHHFSERAQNEIDDSTVQDIFRAKSFVERDDPNRYGYRNFVEQDDMELVDQYIRGTKAGHSVEEGDALSHAVDPFNIVNFQQGGRGLFGIPVGYNASIKKNPGIDPRIDKDYFRNQINEGGRMQVY